MTTTQVVWTRQLLEQRVGSIVTGSGMNLTTGQYWLVRGRLERTVDGKWSLKDCFERLDGNRACLVLKQYNCR